MVPLAQMRTLIFLVAGGAVAGEAAGTSATFHPQSTAPCQGDPGRCKIGDSAPGGCTHGVAPTSTEDPVQHDMGLLWPAPAAFIDPGRADFGQLALKSMLLLFAVMFAAILGMGMLMTSHPPREKPPRGPAIVYAATRTNHLGIDMPSGCKYRHGSAAGLAAECLAAATIDLAMIAKYLLTKLGISLLVPTIKAVLVINRLSFLLGALLGAVLTIALDCCWCTSCFTFNSLLAFGCWLFEAPPENEDPIDSAFMMATADDGWDARKYPMCPPYMGKRGVAWDCFVRDFGAAAAGKGDDENSMEETMLGEDIGGDAPGALPGLQAAQVRRRAKRLRELYAQLYKHIPEPRLREMMHATARNDGRAAFRLLEANCRQNIDDLEMLQQDANWNSATILNSVGFNLDSITLFSRHLNGLNALRPAANRKTEDELTTKFLASIDTSIEVTLGHEAKKELRAQGGARQFINPNNNSRDFQSCVNFFDDMWRSHFRSGDIRPKPRQESPHERSARADANVTGDEDQALIASRSGRGGPQIDRAKMSNERSCWNCRGFGHMAEDCPSEKGFRNISDAIYLLSTMLPRSEKGRGGLGRGGGGRGGAGRGSWRRPMRKFNNARVVLDEGMVVDDDGNIFSDDGLFVGSIATQNAQDEPQNETPADGAGSSNSGEQTTDAADVADDGDEEEEWIGDMFVCLESVYSPMCGAMPFAVPPTTPPDDFDEGELAGYVRCRLRDCRGPCFYRPCEQQPCTGLACECMYCGYWYCIPVVTGWQSCDGSGCMPLTHPSSLFDSVCLSTTFAQNDTLCSALREQEVRLGFLPPTSTSHVSVRAESATNSGSDTDSDSGMPDMIDEDTDNDSDDDTVSLSADGRVVWRSRRQNEIPPSTTPAEVVATTVPSSPWRSPNWHAVFSALSSFIFAIPLTYAMMPAMQAIARGSAHAVDFVCSIDALEAISLAMVAIFCCFRCGIYNAYVALLMQRNALLMTSDTAYIESDSTDRNDWIVDCGATKHCTPCMSDLCVVTDPRPRKKIRVGNGKLLQVTAIGKVRMKVATRGGQHETMELSNVYVVPEMKCRLLSSNWAWQYDNVSTHLNDDRFLRLPSGARVPFVTDTGDGHYRIDAAYTTSDLTNDECDLVHASLAHCSSSRMQLAKHHGYGNLQGYKHDPSKCTACLANKRKKSIAKTSTSGKVYTYFGECVCSDICGEFPESPHGFKYACNFYDRYSHLAAVYFCKTKTSEEIKRCHDTFISDHRQYLKDGKISTWMTDDGLNFHSQSLDQMCVDLSTRRAFAIPHVKEKHGAAERLWGMLLSPSRKMHWHAGNDSGKDGLWPYLFTHVCQVHNALPTLSLSPVMSPYERMTGKRFDLSIFKGKVPLSDCWVNTAHPGDKPINKLGSNNIKAVYLCYDSRRRGDFIYIPELKRITTCWHVTHCPREFTLLGDSVTVRRYRERGDLPTARGAPTATGAQTQAPRDPLATPWPGPLPETPPDNVEEVNVVGSHIDAFTVRCGMNCYVVSPGNTEPVRIPTGYWDAVNDPTYGDKWKEACDEEHNGKFITNRSWVYKEKPSNRALTKSKWVFKVEYKNGAIKRFKARIVACGYSQIEGLDWTENYASTLSADSLRCFCFDANQTGCELQEADVVKAFTHASLEEEIYMAPPEGYAPKDGKVCFLLKGVEGLKQGANGFMKLNAKVIEDEGFSRSMLDPTVFIRTKDGIVLKVACYVDNLLCAYPRGERGRAQCAQFFKAYGKKINLEIRGPPSEFMGVQIEHNIAKGKLFLHQKKYIEKAFHRFCDQSTKLYTTPVQTSGCVAFSKLRPAETDEERMEMSNKPYLSLMGSIVWPTAMTRPDCSYYANYLCQFMSDPTIEAWNAAIALLSYLYNTRSLGLLYERRDDAELSLYSDSSYGEPKPMYGSVIFANGTPISWMAKKQKIVPQSSCEAETAALCAGCKVLIFIYNLVMELGTTVTLPMQTHTDNDATRLSTINPGTTARTKHYEIWMRYCRELYLKLMIGINWVPTKEQIADIFTKPLDKTTFLYLRTLLMSSGQTAL